VSEFPNDDVPSEQEEAIEASGAPGFDGDVPATEAGSGADTIEEYDPLGGSEEPTPGYLQPDEATEAGDTAADETPSEEPVQLDPIGGNVTVEEPSSPDEPAEIVEPSLDGADADAEDPDADPVEAFREPAHPAR